MEDLNIDEYSEEKYMHYVKLKHMKLQMTLSVWKVYVTFLIIFNTGRCLMDTMDSSV